MKIFDETLNKRAALSLLVFFIAENIFPGSLSAGIDLQTTFRAQPEFRAPAFQIPASLASIQSQFYGSRGKTVILIQDAHASPAIQKSIQGILGFLQSTYAVKHMLLEGAAHSVQPELYKIFQTPQHNQAVAEKLFEMGEFTGAEKFLLDQAIEAKCGSHCVQAEGLENPKHYAANLRQFRALKVDSPEIEKGLIDFRLALEKKSTLILNPELQKLFKKMIRIQSSGNLFPERLLTVYQEANEILDLDLRNPRHQIQYPMLVRYFRLANAEKTFSSESAEKEKGTLLQWVRTHGLGELESKIQNLTETTTDIRSGLESIDEIAAPHGFKFELYPHWSRHLGYHALMQEINLRDLQEEITTLEQRLLAALSKTTDEALFLRNYDRFRLLEKLLRLEISREEWKSVQENLNELEPALLAGLIGGLERTEKKLSPYFERALQFYRTAQSREAFFIESLERAFRDPSRKAVAVVAGGFHESGIQKRLKDAGYNFISLVPHAGALDFHESRSHYAEVMLEKSQIAQMLRQVSPFEMTADERGLVQPEFRLEQIKMAAGGLKNTRMIHPSIVDDLQRLIHEPVERSEIRTSLQATKEVTQQEGYPNDAVQYLRERHSNLSKFLTKDHPNKDMPAIYWAQNMKPENWATTQRESVKGTEYLYTALNAKTLPGLVKGLSKDLVSDFIGVLFLKSVGSFYARHEAAGKKKTITEEAVDTAGWILAAHYLARQSAERRQKLADFWRKSETNLAISWDKLETLVSRIEQEGGEDLGEHEFFLDGTFAREVTQDPEYLAATNTGGASYSHRGYRVFLLDIPSQENTESLQRKRSALIKVLTQTIHFPDDLEYWKSTLERIHYSDRLIFWVSPEGNLSAFREDVTSTPFTPKMNAGVVLEDSFRNEEVFVIPVEGSKRQRPTNRISQIQPSKIKVTVDGNILHFHLSGDQGFRSRSEIRDLEADSSLLMAHGNHTLHERRAMSNEPDARSELRKDVIPYLEVEKEWNETVLKRLEKSHSKAFQKLKRKINYKRKPQVYWVTNATVGVSLQAMKGHEESYLALDDRMKSIFLAHGKSNPRNKKIIQDLLYLLYLKEAVSLLEVTDSEVAQAEAFEKLKKENQKGIQELISVLVKVGIEVKISSQPVSISAKTSATKPSDNFSVLAKQSSAIPKVRKVFKDKTDKTKLKQEMRLGARKLAEGDGARVTDAMLIQLLGHPNKKVQREAHRVLGDRHFTGRNCFYFHLYRNDFFTIMHRIDRIDWRKYAREALNHPNKVLARRAAKILQDTKQSSRSELRSASAKPPSFIPPEFNPEKSAAWPNLLNYYRARQVLIWAILSGNAETYEQAIAGMKESAKEISKKLPNTYAKQRETLKPLLDYARAAKADLGFDPRTIGDDFEILRVEEEQLDTDEVKIIQKEVPAFLRALGYDENGIDELAREIRQITYPATLLNLVPHSIREIQYEPEALKLLRESFERFATLERRGNLGLMFANPIGEKDLTIQVLQLNNPVLFRAALFHEIIHLLAFRGALPFDFNNEIVNTAITGLVYTKFSEKAANILKDIGLDQKSPQAWALNQGAQDARDGNLLLKPDQIALKVRTQLEQTHPSLLLENPESPERAEYTVQQLSGYYLAAYLEEFHKKDKKVDLYKAAVDYGREFLPHNVKASYQRKLTYRDWKYIQEITKAGGALHSIARVTIYGARESLQFMPLTRREISAVTGNRWRWDPSYVSQQFKFVPHDILQYGAMSAGFVLQESFRANFQAGAEMTFQEWEEFTKKNPAFQLLFDVADTWRVISRGLKEYPGRSEELSRFYQRRFQWFDLESEKVRMAVKPRFVQFIEGLFYSLVHTETGKKTEQDPRITDQEVKAALDEALPIANQSVHQNGSDFYRLVRDKLWPIAERFWDKDLEEAEKERMTEDAINQMIKDGKFDIDLDDIGEHSSQEQADEANAPELSPQDPQPNQSEEVSTAEKEPGQQQKSKQGQSNQKSGKSQQGTGKSKGKPDLSQRLKVGVGEEGDNPYELSPEARAKLNEAIKKKMDQMTPDQRKKLRERASTELEKKVKQAAAGMSDVTGQMPETQNPSSSAEDREQTTDNKSQTAEGRNQNSENGSQTGSQGKNKTPQIGTGEASSSSEESGSQSQNGSGQASGKSGSAASRQSSGQSSGGRAGDLAQALKNYSDAIERRMKKLQALAEQIESKAKEVEEQAGKSAAKSGGLSEKTDHVKREADRLSSEEVKKLTSEAGELSKELDTLRQKAAEAEKESDGAEVESESVEKKTREATHNLAAIEEARRLADRAAELSEMAQKASELAAKADQKIDEARRSGEELKDALEAKNVVDQIKGRASAMKRKFEEAAQNLQQTQSLAEQMQKAADAIDEQTDQLEEKIKSGDVSPSQGGDGSSESSQPGKAGVGYATEEFKPREKPGQSQTLSNVQGISAGRDFDPAAAEALRKQLEAQTPGIKQDPTQLAREMDQAITKRTGVDFYARAALERYTKPGRKYAGTLYTNIMNMLDPEDGGNLRYQRKGRLDPSRLADAVAGEANVLMRTLDAENKMLRALLLLDVSGSMFQDGQPIHPSLEALMLFLQAFKDAEQGKEKVEIGVGIFSETYKLILPFTDSLNLSAMSRVLGKIFDDSVVGRESTEDLTALKTGIQYMRNSRNQRGPAASLITMISDGASAYASDIQATLLRLKDMAFLAYGIGPNAKAVAEVYQPYGRAVPGLGTLSRTIGRDVRKVYQKLMASSARSEVRAPLKGLAAASSGPGAVAAFETLNFIRVIRKGRQILRVKNGLDTEFEFPVDGRNGRMPEVKLFETPTNVTYLTDIMKALQVQEVSGGVFYVLGEAGTGKNTLIYYLGHLTEKRVRFMPMHKNVIVQDLVERRGVGEEEAGKTSNVPSELIEGMENGDLVVIDEISKAPPEVRVALNQIVQSREASLRGRKVIAKSGFGVIYTDNPQAGMGDAKVYSIHKTSAEQHDRYEVILIDYLPPDEEAQLLSQMLMLAKGYKNPGQIGAQEKDMIENLVNAAVRIRNLYKGDDSQGIGRGILVQRPLSTRNLINIVLRIAAYPEEMTRMRALIERFYSFRGGDDDQISKVEQVINNYFKDNKDYSLTSSDKKGPAYVARNGKRFLSFAGAEVQVKDSAPKSIADIPFRKRLAWTDSNLEILRNMMMDYSQGRHMLFTGYLGTGKDTMAEYFAYLVSGDEAETVGVNPSMEANDLVSELGLGEGQRISRAGNVVDVGKNETGVVKTFVTKAMQAGRPVILSELDKAKPEVTAILNNILQFGWIDLPNGERVVAQPGFVVIGTRNRNRPGERIILNSSEFSGEFLDRFSNYEVDYLPEAEEIQILKEFAEHLVTLDHIPSYKRINDEFIKRVVDLLNELRGAYKRDELPRPVSMRGAKRLIARFALYPSDYKKPGRKSGDPTKFETLVEGNFFYDDREHRKVVVSAAKKVKLGGIDEIVEERVETGNAKLDAVFKEIAEAVKSKKDCLPHLIDLEKQLSNRTIQIKNEGMDSARDVFLSLTVKLRSKPSLLTTLYLGRLDRRFQGEIIQDVLPDLMEEIPMTGVMDLSSAASAPLQRLGKKIQGILRVKGQKEPASLIELEGKTYLGIAESVVVGKAFLEPLRKKAIQLLGLEILKTQPLADLFTNYFVLLEDAVLSIESGAKVEKILEGLTLPKEWSRDWLEPFLRVYQPGLPPILLNGNTSLAEQAFQQMKLPGDQKKVLAEVILILDQGKKRSEVRGSSSSTNSVRSEVRTEVVASSAVNEKLTSAALKVLEPLDAKLYKRFSEATSYQGKPQIYWVRGLGEKSAAILKGNQNQKESQYLAVNEDLKPVFSDGSTVVARDAFTLLLLREAAKVFPGSARKNRNSQKTSELLFQWVQSLDQGRVKALEAYTRQNAKVLMMDWDVILPSKRIGKLDVKYGAFHARELLIKSLPALLEDPDEAVRIEAARAISKLGVALSFKKLIKIKLEDYKQQSDVVLFHLIGDVGKQNLSREFIPELALLLKYEGSVNQAHQKTNYSSPKAREILSKSKSPEAQFWLALSLGEKGYSKIRDIPGWPNYAYRAISDAVFEPFRKDVIIFLTDAATNPELFTERSELRQDVHASEAVDEKLTAPALKVLESLDPELYKRFSEATLFEGKPQIYWVKGLQEEPVLVLKDEVQGKTSTYLGVSQKLKKILDEGHRIETQDAFALLVLRETIKSFPDPAQTSGNVSEVSNLLMLRWIASLDTARSLALETFVRQHSSELAINWDELKSAGKNLDLAKEREKALARKVLIESLPALLADIDPEIRLQALETVAQLSLAASVIPALKKRLRLFVRNPKDRDNYITSLLIETIVEQRLIDEFTDEFCALLKIDESMKDKKGHRRSEKFSTEADKVLQGSSLPKARFYHLLYAGHPEEAAKLEGARVFAEEAWKISSIHIQAGAILTFGYLKAEDKRRFLMEKFLDPNFDGVAGEAIGRIGGDESVKFLRPYLYGGIRSNSEKSKLISASRGLALMGDRESLERMLNAFSLLNYDDARLIRSLRESVLLLAGKEVLSPIPQLLMNSNEAIKESGIKILEAIGTPEAEFWIFLSQKKFKEIQSISGWQEFSAKAVRSESGGLKKLAMDLLKDSLTRSEVRRVIPTARYATQDIFSPAFSTAFPEMVGIYLQVYYPESFEIFPPFRTDLLLSERSFDHHFKIGRVYSTVPDFKHPETRALVDYLARNPGAQFIYTAENSTELAQKKFRAQLVREVRKRRKQLFLSSKPVLVVWKKSNQEILKSLHQAEGERNLLLSDLIQNVPAPQDVLALFNDQTAYPEKVAAGFVTAIHTLSDSGRPSFQGWKNLSQLAAENLEFALRAEAAARQSA